MSFSPCNYVAVLCVAFPAGAHVQPAAFYDMGFLCLVYCPATRINPRTYNRIPTETLSGYVLSYFLSVSTNYTFRPLCLLLWSLK